MPIQLSAPTSDVIRIVEQVPAADRQVNTNEVKAITLIAMVLVTAPEPKVVNREREIETYRPKKSRMSEFREHAMSADDCRLDQLCGCCGHADPEFPIGSNIAVHIGCLVDLACNDPP